MQSCVIFCAGGFSSLAEPVDSTDLIIAADGGLRHLEALGLTPHVILGDFDSLGYVPENARVFPVEKDDTDSILAIRLGLERGYRRFLLYGALDGDRLDHTVANLQSLLFLLDHGAQGYLIGLRATATALERGCLSFPAEARGHLSLFALDGDAAGVTLEGLKYPLQNGILSARFPLGVSNRFLGCPASLRVAQGSLLVIYETGNPFPEPVPI